MTQSKTAFPKIEEIFPESLKAITRVVEYVGLPSREMPDSVLPFVLRGINDDPNERIRKHQDPYATWFPLNQSDWKADRDPTKAMFDAWYGLYGTPASYWDYLLKVRRWKNDQELPEDKSLMALMAHTGRNGSEDPHPEVRNITSANFYGGWGRKLDPSAYLKGQIWIGREVQIRSSVKLIGPVIVGHRSVVESSGSCKRTAVADDVIAGEGVRISDAIIGSGVTIGPGAKLLNAPLQNGVILITDFRHGQKRETVQLERRKQGPFIGDGCRIGANAVIEAGTILMPGCIVGHGEVIRSGIYTNEDLDAYRSRPHLSATN